jgi:hypothetical protein
MQALSSPQRRASAYGGTADSHSKKGDGRRPVKVCGHHPLEKLHEEEVVAERKSDDRGEGNRSSPVFNYSADRTQ